MQGRRGRWRRKRKDERGGGEVGRSREVGRAYQQSTMTKASLVKVSPVDPPEFDHLMPDLHDVGLQLLLGGECTEEHV